MDSYSYTDYELVIELCGVSKCQFLTRPNVMISLLEYIDLFQSELQHEANILEGLYPALYHSILLYFILSIATLINKAYFAWICSYYATILFFSFAFLLFQ